MSLILLKLANVDIFIGIALEASPFSHLFFPLAFIDTDNLFYWYLGLLLGRHELFSEVKTNPKSFFLPSPMIELTHIEPSGKVI